MSISAFQSQRRRTQNVWSCLQPKDIQFPVFEEEREQIPIQEAGIREFWPVFFSFEKESHQLIIYQNSCRLIQRSTSNPLIPAAPDQTNCSQMSPWVLEKLEGNEFRASAVNQIFKDIFNFGTTHEKWNNA